ncbi:MAG: hypothetical protein ACFB4I_14885 [Cyanophyceae cyanobacterium]
MDYLHCFANASLTLRLIEYLESRPDLPVAFMSVIHDVDRWLVRIKLRFPLPLEQDGDFWAFLNELGFPAQPSEQVRLVLRDLEVGDCPTLVMRRYRVVVISHGLPGRADIEAFRQQFIRGLGYCPQHLA